MVAAATPGKPATLQVWRNKAAREVTVKVGEAPREGSVAANDAQSESGRLGMMVRPLSPEERRETDLGAGLVVEGVDGAAEEAGIRPGDIVLSANGSEMKSVADLRKAVAGSRDPVALLVQRGDSRVFVAVQLGVHEKGARTAGPRPPLGNDDCSTNNSRSPTTSAFRSSSTTARPTTRPRTRSARSAGP